MFNSLMFSRNLFGVAGRWLSTGALAHVARFLDFSPSVAGGDATTPPTIPI